MKKILFAIMMLFPLMGVAQNTWEPTQAKNKQTKTEKNKKKSLFEKSTKKADTKYLVGAVPVVNGNVVFTLDKDVPGMNTDQIYDKVREALAAIVAEPNQLKEISKVAIDNKADHTVGARLSEWLVFKNQPCRSTKPYSTIRSSQKQATDTSTSPWSAWATSTKWNAPTHRAWKQKPRSGSPTSGDSTKKEPNWPSTAESFAAKPSTERTTSSPKCAKHLTSIINSNNTPLHGNR